MNMEAPFRPPPESLERARQHLKRTIDEFGFDHQKSIHAEQDVIMIALRIGGYEDTLRQAQSLAERGAALLGPGDRTVLATKFSIGYCLCKLGSVDEGISKIDNTVQECVHALGALDVATIGRQIVAVEILVEVGKIAEARERLAAILRDCPRFPERHFITTRLNDVSKLIEGVKIEQR